MNAKPMNDSISGIYRDGTSSNTVKTNNGYLCYKDFTESDSQVVCLGWGFLPYVITILKTEHIVSNRDLKFKNKKKYSKQSINIVRTIYYPLNLNYSH